MASNATNPAAPPPIPPGLTPIAVVQPALIDIMIGHSFTVILIPLTIALFYFSTNRSRRQPIYILNLANICLAFAVGVMGDCRAINTMLSPTRPYPVLFDIFIGILGAIQTIFVDIILLVRLISVHPYTHVGPKRFIQLIALPVILKIARFVNLFMFVAALAKVARAPNAEAVFANLWLTAPYLKIEWFSQLIDNIYASSVFLWTVHARSKNSHGSVTINERLSFGRRLKTLFWIALSNFVFPALFSVVQIIVVYRAISPVVVNQICLVNTSIAVIGVVFATVWAGSVRKKMDQSMAAAPSIRGEETKHSVMQFAPSQTTTDSVSSTHQAHSTYISLFETDKKTRSENFDLSVGET
ncbi:hypothetical protein F5I97DRAFT_849158 [Phlebopus sp. FC_14]|nr:hypothetical protein F5I97DRAFT_849158 [Phlebopus sp. FC_14]